MQADMILLLTGLEAARQNENLCKNNHLELDENRFFKSENMQYHRNCSRQEGIFMAGSCICPMSVNETLDSARSAAIEVDNS